MSSSEKPKVEIVKACVGDEEKVFKFLQTNFFQDEPMSMSQSRGLIPMESCQSLKHIQKGNSFLAVCKNPDNEEYEIVGVALNGEWTPDVVELFDKKIKECTDEKHLNILKLLRRVEAECDVLKKRNIARAFETTILAVDRNHRGLNIGTRLMEHSVEAAKKANYSHLKVICTSYFSAAIMDKLKFECIYELPWEQHRHENGEIVFKTQPPHKGVRVFLHDIL